MQPRRPTRAALRAALAEHEKIHMGALPGKKNDQATGVLVPIVWKPDPICVATRRSAGLREHAGEVCFPGGRPEPGDRDLAQTALREAAEELGIVGAELLGELSSIPLYTSEYRLHPFVAAIEDAELLMNPDEVSEVLELPLETWLAQPVLHAIPWEHEGKVHLSPVFDIDGRLMFGATAHVFHELLTVAAPLFGRPMPPLRAGKHRWEDVLELG